MNVSDLIGLPYKDGGRSLSGVDCWGLCIIFYQCILGRSIPSYRGSYTSAEKAAEVAVAIEENAPKWTAVDGQPEFGDILVFTIKGLPIHTAVYIGNGDFIHAFKHTNSCIERLDSINWQRRLTKVLRWNGN